MGLLQPATRSLSLAEDGPVPARLALDGGEGTDRRVELVGRRDLLEGSVASSVREPDDQAHVEAGVRVDAAKPQPGAVEQRAARAQGRDSGVGERDVADDDAGERRGEAERPAEEGELLSRTGRPSREARRESR